MSSKEGKGGKDGNHIRTEGEVEYERIKPWVEIISRRSSGRGRYRSQQTNHV